jgi:hypothetical protein
MECPQTRRLRQVPGIETSESTDAQGEQRAGRLAPQVPSRDPSNGHMQLAPLSVSPAE